MLARFVRQLRNAFIATLALATAACAPALSNAPRPAASAPPVPRVTGAPPASRPLELNTPPPVSPPASEPAQVTTAPLVESPPVAASSIAAPTSPPLQPEAAQPPTFSPPRPPEAAPAPTFSPPAPTPSAHNIVLVLPLESATFGQAAEAVAAGFRAAAELAETSITVIGHGDGDVLGAIDKARAARANVVVGPLLRDDLKALLSYSQTLPWTIALNQLEEDAPLPERIYSLALSIEGEGRQIARTMQSDGVRNVAIVAGDSPLQRRFAASFIGQWILLGGGAPGNFRILRTPEGLTALRQELQRAAPGAILLAADANDAALARPYLPRTLVYASSQVSEAATPQAMYDLEDIHFVEVPWLVDTATPQFASIPRPDWLERNRSRLYALGIDAFAVALAFEHGAPERLDIEGATGHLSLGAQHRIMREGRLAHFEAGRVVADTVR